MDILSHTICRNNFTKEGDDGASGLAFLFIKLEVLFCIYVELFVVLFHDQCHHFFNLQIEYHQVYQIHVASL